MWRSPSRSISKGVLSARASSGRASGGESGLAGAQGRDDEPRRLAGDLDEEGDLAVGQPPDLGATASSSPYPATSTPTRSGPVCMGTATG